MSSVQHNMPDGSSQLQLTAAFDPKVVGVSVPIASLVVVRKRWTVCTVTWGRTCGECRHTSRLAENVRLTLAIQLTLAVNSR